ncbi:hypothetical protein F4820DRAFT_244802 [Hypoxylon rubiginosum]|uniref:Uncharacterized protein n=1 Tax=Hypoxylon rubiginosum TaxID=110542 RepID=A0ACB9YFV1_9PEZI|nr:hypothetical protein F4820DRAFT_244802 [Hypoxylon rubiginosum]
MPTRILVGAICVQRFDDSLNSAIHITYRISLRSSSMPEPRDPLLKVLTYFVFVFRDTPLKTELGSPPAERKVQLQGSYRVGTYRVGGLQGSSRVAAARRRGNDGKVHKGLGVFVELSNDPSAGSPTETFTFPAIFRPCTCNC